MSTGLPPGYAVNSPPPGYSVNGAKAAQPTAPKPKPNRPHHSLLELASDALETPYSLIDATMIDNLEGRPGIAPGSRTRDVFRALLHGDVTDPAEQYGIGTPNVLQLEAQHGDPVAKFLKNHPLANTAATMGFELVNPSNLLTGEVLGWAGKAAKYLPPLLKNVPGAAALAQHVTEPVLRTFNRFRGLHVAGGDVAENLGRRLISSVEGTEGEAQSVVKRIFGSSTTRAQRIEIARRSQGLPAQQVAETRGATIDQRAADLRSALKNLDEAQRAAHPDLLPADRTYDPETYFPMRGAFRDPGLDESNFYQPQGAGARYTVTKGTLGAGKHKAYATIDDAIASGKLADDFDPADTFMRHLVERTRNVAFEKGMQAFGSESDLLKPLVFTHGGNILGTGAEGAANAQRYAAGTARAVAQRKAAEQLGLSLPEMLRRSASIAPQIARVATQRAAANRFIPLSKLSQEAASRTLTRAMQNDNTLAASRDIADPAYNLAKRTAGLAGDMNQRLDELVGKLTDDRALAADRRAFAREVSKIFPGIEKSVLGKIENESVAEPGHVRAADALRATSPTLKASSIHPELAKFLEDANAPREAAHGMAAWIDNMNRLTRLGIIANPVNHVAWNMLNNYLGAGGDVAALSPAAKVNIWRDGAPEWEALARHYGAITAQSASVFGGKASKILTSTMSELSPLEKAGKVVTNVWDANQKLVFDTFERRFATALFKTMVERGATPERAAIDVRKTLGDYANVTTAEHSLNKALFFYPWLKTVIPLWLKTGAQSPQTWNAPMRGLQSWNAGMGDPNAGQTAPFTAYLGNHGGRERYVSAPFPQRIIGDIASIGDPHQPLQHRLNSTANIAADHLNTLLGTLLDAARTLYETPKEPGGGNFHTLFDKDAPIATQLTQLAANAGKKLVPPFALGAPGAAKDALTDPLALLGVTGGYTYTRPEASQEKGISRLRHRMDRDVSKLRARGLDDAATRRYKMLQELIDALEAK
jgi:hypothetical protein